MRRTVVRGTLVPRDRRRVEMGSLEPVPRACATVVTALSCDNDGVRSRVEARLTEPVRSN